MRLLQRYILIELIRDFSFSLSVVTVLLVFVGLFQEASEHGLGPLQVLKILPYVVPSLLPFTVPATLLLTVSVVYGRIAGDQEITAAKAAGINVLSLLWPAFGLGAVLSVGALVLTDQVIPWAVVRIQTTATAAMEDVLLEVLRTESNYVDRAKGIEISVMDVEGKSLVLPTFRYGPPGSTPVTVQADRGTVEFDLQQQEVVLHLEKGRIIRPGQVVVWMENVDERFPLPREIHPPKPRHLRMVDIRSELERVQLEQEEIEADRDIEVAMALTQGAFRRLDDADFQKFNSLRLRAVERADRLRTEYHSRFALAGSCLFFVLVGGPFSVLQARRQFLTSFFLCFMPILLMYYPTVMLMMNLSKTGSVDPAYAMWVGNLILAAAACYLIRKVSRH